MYRCLFVTLAGSLLVCNAEELFPLNIIHHNDFHARFDETGFDGTTCIPEEAECIGGFARLVTAVNEILEVEPDSIILDGGDTFQGTLWYNFLRWNVTQYFMNMLPHDAHVFGNHEFDHGIDGVVPYLEHLKAPMLGANVNSTFEPSMQGLYQHHTIIERNGRQIGIIGVLLTSFAAPVGDLIIEDELEAINREAALLNEQGVDIIIVLSHCGYDADMYFAANVGREVDIIVGAHSHTLLYTGEPPNGDTAWGEYPTVVEQANGHRVPIVQASCYTRYLGNIKFYIDDEGTVQGWDGQPIFLGTNIVPDPQITELLEPFKQEMDAIGKEVLARSKVVLNRSWCNTGECNLGSLACDAFLEEVMELADGNQWHHAHLCLTNRGGYRVQINQGDITTEALLLAIPFENTIQLFSMRGDHLLETLEFSVGVYVEPGTTLTTNRMLQVGGIRVVYNASQPVGSRVQSAKIRCIECDVPIYEDIDMNKTYRIVSQDYIGEGGDGYSVIAENRFDVVNIGLDYVLLQNYLRKVGVVVQDLDGRIQVVY